MVIGLVFFIRASTKDRIEVMQFRSRQQAEALQQALLKYFYARAYRPVERSGEEAIAPASGPTITNGTTLVGMVSPSVFMAVFLSALAAVGFVCLALVMATLFPTWGSWLLGLVLASPLAGVFYWRKSNRPETVVLRVDALEAADLKADVQTATVAPAALSKLTIKGHRDELADLQNAFAQPELKAWAALEKCE